MTCSLSRRATIARHPRGTGRAAGLIRRSGYNAAVTLRETPMERHRVSSWLFLLLLAFLVPCLSAAPAAAAQWQPLSLWGGGVRLVAAVDDPSVVYAVTPAAGLFRSTDRGATWRFVAYPPERLGIRVIAVDPHDPQRLFITAWAPSPAFTYSGFYRSED